MPSILNRLGLTKNGAEVGVQRGHHARSILEQWPGRLYCVDSWAPVPGYHTKESQDAIHAEAVGNLTQYQDRIHIMPMASVEAADYIAKSVQQLDFVYLDADHSYESVRADISAWWPIVRRGGVLAGHDYVIDGTHENDRPFDVVPDGTPGAHLFGVRRAVNEFAAKEGLELSLTASGTDEGWQSWLVVKR